MLSVFGLVEVVVIFDFKRKKNVEIKFRTLDDIAVLVPRFKKIPQMRLLKLVLLRTLNT